MERHVPKTLPSLKTSLLLACLLLLQASLVSARKTYLVKSEHAGRVPRTRQTTTTKRPYYTFFSNDDDFVALEYEVKLELGWEWTQDFKSKASGNPDYYLCQLDFFLKSTDFFKLFFSFPRLFYLEPYVEAKEFQGSFRLDVYYFYDEVNNNDRLCFNGNLVLDQIPILSQVVFRLQNCYKMFITCFFNWSQWYDEEAKIFEKCEQSTKVDIIMYERDFIQQQMTIFGGSEIEKLRVGNGCTPDQTFLPLLISDTVNSAWTRNFMSYLFAVDPVSAATSQQASPASIQTQNNYTARVNGGIEREPSASGTLLDFESSGRREARGESHYDALEAQDTARALQM